jgi:hypothetical protein
MAYLSEKNLCEMGFKSLGKDVKISDRASIYNADQIEIGDQKIDVLLSAPNLTRQPIHEVAEQQGISL